MSKKSKIRVTAGILGLLGIAFLCGPRIDQSEQLRPLALPMDLDRYLSQQESQYPDIVPGTEKTIVWAQQAGTQSEYALVFLHGFSASRQEIAPVPQQLAKALNANLFLTRFTGHGRGSEAMAAGSVNAWLNDSHEALEIGKRLGKKVIVMAVSTGGSAATWLASQQDPQLHALILISPNYGITNRLAYLMAWPWGNYLLQWIQGPYREWQPKNKAEATYWTWRYPSSALLPMMGMIKLTERLPFESIQTPTLLIYHPEDKVVNARRTEGVFDRLGSPQNTRWVYAHSKDPDKHVLIGDIVSPGSETEVVPEMLAFLDKLK